MSFWLIHLPDAICLYRAIASVLALLLGVHPATPWLFSSALISDLFDGWIFRKYVRDRADHHPWSPLHITKKDPLADFTLLLCGSFYACRHLFHLNRITALAVIVFITVITLVLNRIPFVTPQRSATVYIVCITAVTHFVCGLMVASALASWYVCYPTAWQAPSAITITLFYGIFALIGDKTRLIRRPPADFFCQQ